MQPKITPIIDPYSSLEDVGSSDSNNGDSGNTDNLLNNIKSEPKMEPKSIGTLYIDNSDLERIEYNMRPQGIPTGANEPVVLISINRQAKFDSDLDSPPRKKIPSNSTKSEPSADRLAAQDHLSQNCHNRKFHTKNLINNPPMRWHPVPVYKKPIPHLYDEYSHSENEQPKNESEDVKPKKFRRKMWQI